MTSLLSTNQTPQYQNHITGYCSLLLITSFRKLGLYSLKYYDVKLFKIAALIFAIYVTVSGHRKFLFLPLSSCRIGIGYIQSVLNLVHSLVF